jgi:2-oxoglutarate ferredoxin oxidoreductase subunit delta
MPIAALAPSHTSAGSEESDHRKADLLEASSEANGISIKVYRHYCKGCEICAEVCPKGVLRMEIASDRWEGAIVEIVDVEACNACMLCEHQCPDFAIEVFSLKKEAKAKEKKVG